MKLMPLTKKVKCRRSPSLFISAAKSVNSCQRASSVQLSNAITTNCGGRSAARAGTHDRAARMMNATLLMAACTHGRAKPQAIPGFYVNGAALIDDVGAMPQNKPMTDTKTQARRPVMLVVLDGWGWRE